MASIEENPTTTELTVADVIALLPEKGKEIATVHKSNIAWFQAALAVLAISVGDKSAHRECKAALSTYYMNLNATKSEVKEVDGPAAKSTEKGDALFAHPGSGRPVKERAFATKSPPGLHWKAHPKPGLALMPGSLKSLMALIAKAWTDQPGMLHWITEQILSACPEEAVLGVGAPDLEAPHLAICDGTGAASAPLVQASLCLERDNLKTFPETHPLRGALADLASNARTSGTNDCYFWLLKRFDAFSAPPELDESTINNRESVIFPTVFNTGGAAIRAGLKAYKNEVDEITLALKFLGCSSPLLDGSSPLLDGKWTRHFKEMLKRSPSATFAKGGPGAFKDDAKFGRPYRSES